MDVLAERTANIVLDDDDDDLEESHERMPLKDRRLSTAGRRRRRRSSARFLRLGDDDHDGGSIRPNENLGDVYQKAIRMNAENRINASNSWNLSLIDHMDRFLSTQGNTSLNSNNTNLNSTLQSQSSQRPATVMEDTLGPITGVNFTKASCTLDASVKIYSYRVDDVHLTSYKVLANLNRTDNGKKARNARAEDAGSDDNNDNDGATEKRKHSGNVETLESNTANINIHKLDAAFDIDPLFHKMSKTFDEGGAKGLLLANLGVSDTGCNIVFDSTLDNEAGTEESKEAEVDPDAMEDNEALSIDVTSLALQLDSTLHGQTLHQLSLVPQLASLRTDHTSLKQEGFVEKIQPSERYAAPQEEEIEADRSIHVEAIERSRASQADLGRSMMEADDSSFGSDNGGGFAPDDFGGDDDDDFAVSFIHDGDHRYSSASFQTTFEAAQPPSQTTVLLDAIAAGEISGSQSNYEYFNKKALENIQGNQWAGAFHWKKMQPKQRGKAAANSESSDKEKSTSTRNRKGRTKKTKTKDTAIIDLGKKVNLKSLFRKPPRGKRGSSALQMTKAAVTKATKNDNLLPLDAGLKVESLGSLFLRPNTNVLDFASKKTAPPRNVGFGGVETWGDSEDYGGEDDGGLGYDFGGGDDDHDDLGGDFVVPELEGVRKVQKVEVGYATVAKKVDVKRLKKDLWVELERTLHERGQIAGEEFDHSENADADDASMEDDDQSDAMEPSEEEEKPSEAGPLSFQNTVRDMQSSQTQADVTLPFYFICVLHLANEKGLALESKGLEDFLIHGS